MTTGRYKLMYYDEWIRLWCEEHYEEIGCELEIWNEIDPVPVEDIIRFTQEHEKEHHAEK